MDNIKKVKIIWEDAWSDTEYLELCVAGHVKAIMRESVGYLLREDDDVIVFTSGIVDNLFKGRIMMDGIHIIPKGMVKGIIYLTDAI